MEVRRGLVLIVGYDGRRMNTESFSFRELTDENLRFTMDRSQVTEINRLLGKGTDITKMLVLPSGIDVIVEEEGTGKGVVYLPLTPQTAPTSAYFEWEEGLKDTDNIHRRVGLIYPSKTLQEAIKKYEGCKELTLSTRVRAGPPGFLTGFGKPGGIPIPVVCTHDEHYLPPEGEKMEEVMTFDYKHLSDMVLINQDMHFTLYSNDRVAWSEERLGGDPYHVRQHILYPSRVF